MMTCQKLNEGVYSNIKSVLDYPKAKIGPSEETYYKSIYGPATLINDWYEKRIENPPEEAQTQPPLSENMDSYRKPCIGIMPDRGEYFSKIFDSYGLGQELLTDHLGFSYYDNYTTTNDLMFGHLAKGICGPFPRHYFKGQYLPETDLTNVYGNLTQWGLKETVYRSMPPKIQCKEAAPVSETIAAFGAYDLQAVKKINDFKTFKRIKVSY